MGNSEQAVSEAQMIGAFLRKGREERWAAVLGRPKGRREFLSRLRHENDVSPECMVPIPHTQRFAPLVYERLRGLGAPDTCHIISDRRQLDGREMPLREALDQTVDQASGTIIVCVPGKLAYYFSEERNGQYLLLASNQRHDR